MGGGGYFIKFEKWFMPHPSFQEIQIKIDFTNTNLLKRRTSSV
jgi:hypothetical protein